MGISQRCSVVVVVCCLTAHSLSAQPIAITQLLDRMGDYLTTYEPQLSSVVAEEHFEQNVYPTRRGATSEHVTLESEVAFTRLPGDAEWLGFREVRKRNWKAIKTTGPSMAEVLASSTGDLAKAVAIARASAQHNLGLARTINMPTTPLDVIHPRHRHSMRYEFRGDDSVRGRRTVVVSFVEVGRPTLLREPTGENLVSSGRVWMEASNGKVWRVEWHYQREGSPGRPPYVRVDFAPNEDLQLMVPVTMTEGFYAARGRGEGRATYRNFRRFGTSARIVPQ